MLRRTARPHVNVIYHSETNQWTTNYEHLHNEPIIEEENENETMELLETSARNSSTIIRPYIHHYYSDIAV